MTMDDIQSIRVLTHKNAKQGSDIPDYQTVLHARLSLQYGMGSMIVRGRAGLQEYTEESIKDERVKKIASLIEIEADPEIQKTYPEIRTTIVEITDIDGQIFASRVDYAKGDPLNPMSDEDLMDKFRDVTQTVLTAGRQKKVMDWIMDEGTLTNPVQELTDMLLW